MAWRLVSAGYEPLILVENRRKLLQQKRTSEQSAVPLQTHGGQAGSQVPGTCFSRCLAPLALVRRHGFAFLRQRVMELLWIKTHFCARKLFGQKFKSPAYLSIEELALAYPLRLVEVDSHNGPAALGHLRAETPDVGILTNTRKIGPAVLACARQGFFNVHSSALPKYAGLDAIFWALYHGEKEIGVSVHEAVPEIDRGRLAAQAKITVTAWDDETSLARKASWVGTALMLETLEKLQAGTLEMMPQPEEGASYFSWPTREQRTELKKRWKVEGGRWKRNKHCKKIRMSGDLAKNKDLIADEPNSAFPSTFDLPPSTFRILHIITRMTRGGAQENTLATIRGLRAKGYQAVLVTGPAWGPEGEILSQALREGHEIVLLPELGREIDVIKDTLAFWKLFWLVKRGRFDLVHTHMSKGGLLGRLAAWLAGSPHIVHTPHGHIFHSYFSRATERFFLFLERRLARVTDRLIALTESEKREHVNFYVGSASQWCVIPSGVDETRFQEPSAAQKLELRRRLGIPPGTLIAGFVGRLESIKGPVYFVRAMPDILKTVPKTHFLMVGAGRLRQSLEEEVRQLGLAEHVTWTGDQKQTALYFSIMDAVVVPSLNEGMGRVIVEAGLLSRPVAASRVGGIPDLVIGGKTGLLVPPKDPAALAQASLQILQDTLLALKLGKNLKEHVTAGFTESQMVGKIEVLYQSILKA